MGAVSYTHLDVYKRQAGISGGDPMKTGWSACKVGFAGFVVPFLFVYNPALLGEGAVLTILWCSITGIFGVMSVSAGFQGWFFQRLNTMERLIMVAGGMCMVIPEFYTDIIGIVVVVAMFFSKKILKRKRTANV